jgi:hypothetical protein
VSTAYPHLAVVTDDNFCLRLTCLSLMHSVTLHSPLQVPLRRRLESNKCSPEAACLPGHRVSSPRLEGRVLSTVRDLSGCLDGRPGSPVWGPHAVQARHQGGKGRGPAVLDGGHVHTLLLYHSHETVFRPGMLCHTTLYCIRKTLLVPRAKQI